MVQLKLAPATSKNLFSRHYLESRLKTLPTWGEEIENERVFGEIKKLYEKEKTLLPNYEESQLEENFIKPVLRILGHAFEVQQSSDRSALTPDYAFFPDDETKREAQKNKEKVEFYKKAIAVGDAKKWGIPLDRKSRGRALYEFTNPSFQIDIYLRDTGTAWGILTNGKFWRLYYREKNPIDSYYEVDLQAILESDSKADFKYFHLFFRKQAFIKDATGKNFLEKVYSEGVDYAKKVSRDLEKNIYKALKILAQGFLARTENSLELTEETVKRIHENSLIFLYRTLFILYADSRGLLKTYTPGYEFYNITNISRVCFNKRQDGSASEHSLELWVRLNELFKLIDEGSESRGIPKHELYVPPYNGGLFKQDGEYKFLSEKKLGDEYIVDVLYLLTVSEEEGEKGFIDYSTLEIRHLGSIYEGLLEYKLKIAEEDIVAVKEKDKQVWIPKNKANSKKVLDQARKGELYLVTDKGERKATGSYYTPDYIVKYIVENTLSPIVKEKLNGATTDKEKIERILSIKVLDPAMGSGHFLVEAMNFLANKIVPFISPEMLKEEKEIEWARREVIKRCIYGVDLNPLATELAKLSLWLATISGDHPLSFLDHHLKFGNSLVGAELKKLDVYPKEWGNEQPQAAISDFIDVSVKNKILGLVRQHLWLTSKEENTIIDIKKKEEHFDLIEKSGSKRMLEELGNLQTSFFFGNEYVRPVYMEALDAFRKGEEAWKSLKENEHFKRAQEIAKEKNFFHWKLEFPDVFFDKNGERKNPGFDVVIGNPPYVNINALSESFRNYFKLRFSTYRNKSDLFSFFLENDFSTLSGNKKYIGYIVPVTILSLDSFSLLRKLFFDNGCILSVVQLPLGTFKDAVVRPVILIIEKDFEHTRKRTKIALMGEEFQIKAYLPVSLVLENPRFVVDVEYSKDKSKIYEAIKRCPSTLLENVLRFTRGIKTSDDERFVSLAAKDLYSKKVIRGGDLEPYLAIWDEEYIWYRPDLMKEKVGCLPHTSELFEVSEKLITQRVNSSRQLIVAYDNKQFYTLDTTNVSNMKSWDGKHALLYIASILNSALINYWYCEQFTAPTISGYELHQIPIRLISFTTAEKERTKLFSELKQLYASSNLTEILSRIDSYLPKDSAGNFIVEKEKSDVVHDVLAFLAEQMIEMSKQKNSEIKGFTGWLEREIGAKIEDLSNKTAIKEYYSSSFEDLVAVLKKNKSKLGLDPCRREFQDKMKKEFDSSVSKLKPFIEKIRDTDKLIDQIVYKLYGLTDEEIKIVEDAG